MVVFIVLLVFIPGSNKKRKAFRRRMMRHPISHISPHVHNFTIGVSTDRAHRLPLLDPHTTAYGRFGGRDFFRPTCFATKLSSIGYMANIEWCLIVISSIHTQQQWLRLLSIHQNQTRCRHELDRTQAQSRIVRYLAIKSSCLLAPGILSHWIPLLLTFYPPQ